MKRSAAGMIMIWVFLLLLCSCSAEQTPVQYSAIDLSEFSDSFHHARYLYENEIPPWELYQPEQILGIAENILAWQNPDGGWSKNLDYQRVCTQEERMELRKEIPEQSTLDNRNIYPQIRYLCSVYAQACSDPDVDAERYREAAVRALQWILAAQHPVSGGFSGFDADGITYNDDVMTGTLRLLRDIGNEESLFLCLPEELRDEAGTAYRRGIDCILQTQITVTLPDGTSILTAWCQQHSHEPPFQPVWARSFEPPSICSRESFEVLKLLMEEPSPSEAVRTAVFAGCSFFAREDVRIQGRAIVTKEIDPIQLGDRLYHTDRTMEADPQAQDLWARFYALDNSFDVVSGAPEPITGEYPSVLQPIWCDRGCTYKGTYNELSMERRNGYDYVTRAGDSLLKRFDEWKNSIE